MRLWDVETGQQATDCWNGHTNWVNSIAFSPDGKLLASASCDKTVRIWDVEAGKQTKGALEGLTSAALLPDGKLLSSRTQNWTVRILDVTAGPKPMAAVGSNTASCMCGGEFMRKILNTLSMKDKRLEQSQVDSENTWCITSVVFSPDGKLLATSGSGDKAVRIWDVATGQEVMAQLRGSVLSWYQVSVDSMQDATHGVVYGAPNGNRRGNLIVTAEDDQVYIYLDSQKIPTARYRAPARVLSISCMGENICAGLSGGQVRCSCQVNTCIVQAYATSRFYA